MSRILSGQMSYDTIGLTAFLNPKRLKDMDLLGMSSRPPTKDEFAKLVRERIRKAGETADIVYDRERFCLFQGDKDGHTLFLANAYTVYCSAPEAQRPQVLQQSGDWHLPINSVRD